MGEKLVYPLYVDGMSHCPIEILQNIAHFFYLPNSLLYKMPALFKLAVLSSVHRLIYQTSINRQSNISKVFISGKFMSASLSTSMSVVDRAIEKDPEGYIYICLDPQGYVKET